MTKISAFVGHSFLPEDETIVRKFTDFFDQIAKSHDFNWVHATEPRPDDVASKVLDLIEDCNLFIGICTPNERVAKDHSFTNMLLGKQFRISREDLQSKTSDWIIQEIGLAIGRKMKIIILLQNGVRKPGSLQGNIEYIPFDRDGIEKSFSNILGMITNLQGSGVSSALTSAPQNEGTASDDDHDEELNHDIEEPNETWDVQKFDFEYFKAVIFEDQDRAKVVSEAWLARVGSDPEAIATWRAGCLLSKTRYTDENYLSEIKSIAEEHPNNGKIQTSLALAYEYFEDFERAREQFNISLEQSTDNAEKRSALNALARVYEKLGDINSLESTISELRSLVESKEDEKNLLSTLEKLPIWYSDNKMLKLAMLERELEIEPADIQKRFQLAYAHSEIDNNSLTMYHYEKIPHAQRDATTWNNLGVVYQGFSLSGMSVSAYQTAADQGETLAMSNLAGKLMSAGFLNEAKSELQRARATDDPHRSVAKSQVQLDSIASDEKENQKKKLKGAPELSQFLSTVGHCIWQAMPANIGEKWVDGDVSIAVSRVNNRVTAKGSYQKDKVVNGLVSALGGTSEKSKETYDVTIAARFVGSVLVGEYKSERRGAQVRTAGIFDFFDNKQDFIAIYEAKHRVLRCLIGEDLKELQVQD